MSINTCHECSREFRANCTVVVRCPDCYEILAKLRSRICVAIKQAQRRGELAVLRDTPVACADCGNRADRYDHRDYLKPLSVEPVCHGCNNRRGPAIPFVSRMLEAQ